MGVGDNEKRAEVEAWKNAFGKALNEGGLVGIKAQAKTLDDVLTMNDLETMIPANVMPRRLVCQTLPIYVAEKKVKVYVLLQVKSDDRKPTDFSNYGNLVTCEPEGFGGVIESWNSKMLEQKRGREIAEQERIREEEKRRRQQAEEEARKIERAKTRAKNAKLRDEIITFSGGICVLVGPVMAAGGESTGVVATGWVMTIGSFVMLPYGIVSLIQDHYSYGRYMTFRVPIGNDKHYASITAMPIVSTKYNGFGLSMRF
jgi:hypothetical protein